MRTPYPDDAYPRSPALALALCALHGCASAVAPADVVEAAANAPDPQRSCSAAGTPACGLVAIPGGTFTLGDDLALRAGPTQPMVTVGAFEIDRYEVSVGRFRAYWSAGHPPLATSTLAYPGNPAFPAPGVVTEPIPLDATVPETDWHRFCTWTRAPSDQEADPLVGVDWPTAQAFCVWDGGRLPTEAEWEFAARGTDGRPWPWGATPVGNRACWNRCPSFPDNGMMCTGSGVCAEDGTYASGASPFGVMHMSGNVWEWTADLAANYEAGSWCGMTHPTDPICLNGFVTHMARGGAWNNNSDVALRAATRQVLEPTYVGDSTGFRCARSAR